MKSKTGLYFLSALTFTLLLSGLRTACFLTSYEADVGYFASTSLVLITKILYPIGAAWCLAAPLLLPKNGALEATFNTARSICSKIAGSLFLFSGICLLIGAISKMPVLFGSVAALRPILGIFAALAAVFFFTDGSRTPKKRTTHAAFGFASLAFLFALLFYVYFDMYVTINSPIKNSLQLATLSAMLFVLYEIRDGIGRPALRLSVPIKLLCALFCIPTAVSHLIFERSSLCGALEKDLLSPFFSLALLGIGIFALVTLPSGKELDKDEKKFEKPLDKNKEA